MQSSNAFKYIKTSEWDVNANRYMQPRVSDRGLKMISIISQQRNKKLHIQVPATKCWGIEDYVDQQTQESDGKFKIKLHFNSNGTPESNDALEKLIAFEQKVIDDAVINSEAWLGKKLGRELVEDRYTPFLKVGKNKETREADPSKGHYFSPKVNCYDNKWDVEVFDIDSKEKVFPSEDEDKTPADFVAKGSDVICGIECKYIWVGAKGWGITWALKQCAVKPKEMEQNDGFLQLDLGQPKASSSTVPATTKEEEVVEETPKEPVVEIKKEEEPEPTYMANSDDDEEETKEEEEQEEEQQPEPEPEPVKKVVKKSVVKKTVAKEDATTPAEPAAAPAKVVKKVVRKKV